MVKFSNSKAFSLVEMIISVAVTLILLLMVYNFYGATKGIFTAGIPAQALQDGSHIILSKIIEGKTEPGGIFRLQDAVFYSITSISELHFTGTDNVERWFKLNNGSTQLIYHHPTSGGTIDEVVYTAPTGSIITLRFAPPTVANYSAAVVGIDAAITQTVSGKAISGSASTVVNLRNHP